MDQGTPDNATSAVAQPTLREKLSGVFNWLAQTPERNYTLVEAFQHFAQKKPYADINDNRLGFTNAGRLTERLHMFAGVASAALVIASVPFSAITLPVAFAAAAGFVGLYKCMGLAGGKLADLAVSGRLYTKPQKKPTIPLA